MFYEEEDVLPTLAILLPVSGAYCTGDLACAGLKISTTGDPVPACLALLRSQLRMCLYFNVVVVAARASASKGTTCTNPKKALRV